MEGGGKGVKANLEKSRIRETPNLSTNANRSTDTVKKHTRVFFFFWGFG